MKAQLKRCVTCEQDLPEDLRIEAYWKKAFSRVNFCLPCFGEIFFDILPRRTSSGKTSLATARGILRARKVCPVKNNHPMSR